MATSVTLEAPVGLRWRTQPVRSLQSDQNKVIQLLSSIPQSKGGKKETWGAGTIPLAGGDGDCANILVDAIWAFQQFWLQQGVFHVIDNVVDPRMHTLQKLNELATGPPTPPGGGEQLKREQLIQPQPRVTGTWQVTNMWSAGLGELGLVSAAEIEITQPDNKKFTMRGAGAGFGFSLDPKGLSDLAKGAKSAANEQLAKALAESMARGVGFSIGDLLAKIPGASVLTPTATRGVIFANPFLRLIGQPVKPVSRTMLTGGSGGNVVGITSAAAGVVVGGEAGIILFRGLGLGTFFLAEAIAVYGSGGVTLKAGAGVQGIAYYMTVV